MPKNKPKLVSTQAKAPTASPKAVPQPHPSTRDGVQSKSDPKPHDSEKMQSSNGSSSEDVPDTNLKNLLLNWQKWQREC